MLSGDWDVFEGKTFTMLHPEVHFIDARAPFGGKVVPPHDWERIICPDHCTVAPTAAERSPGDEAGNLRG